MKTIFDKPYVWSFLGQVKGKPTRENMLAELKQVRGEHFIHITERWNDQNQIEVKKYKEILSDSIFVPCPSGWGGARGLTDCFRLYEALEAGSIPIVEKDDFAYFDKFFPNHPILQTPDDWLGISDDMESLLEEPKKLQEYNEALIKWWQDYKSNLKTEIKNKFLNSKINNKLNMQNAISASFMSIDRSLSIQNKWATILHQLKSRRNVLAATSNLYSVNKKQTIQQYIDADTDIALCEHNYNAWGCNIESSLSSVYIYIKYSPKTLALIEALHFQLSNIQEDDRFFSYKEQYADYELQKLIESQGGGLKIKKIKNDKFAVSEEIYGKNIEHYKSNPPAYINFDRNVYTEELKKVYFDASSNTK